MDEQAGESAFMSVGAGHRARRLQTAASATVSAASTRASLTCSVVEPAGGDRLHRAIARRLQAAAATVIPAHSVLGCFPVVRLVDTTVESNQFARGIAHIHGSYTTLTRRASAYIAAWRAGDNEAAEPLTMRHRAPAGHSPGHHGQHGDHQQLDGGVAVAVFAIEVLETRDVLAIPLGGATAVAFITAYTYEARRYPQRRPPTYSRARPRLPRLRHEEGGCDVRARVLAKDAAARQPRRGSQHGSGQLPRTRHGAQFC